MVYQFHGEYGVRLDFHRPALMVYQFHGADRVRRPLIDSLAIMNTVLSCDDAKQLMIEVLQREVALHEVKKFSELGDGYEEVDATISRYMGPEFKKVQIALEFWGAWLDSCEHDWFHYEPLRETEWSVLARRIIADLNADPEISDPVVVEKFTPRPRLAFSVRGFLRRLFGTGGTNG